MIILESANHLVKRVLHKPSSNKMAVKILYAEKNRFPDPLIKEKFKHLKKEVEIFRSIFISPNIVDFYGLCLYKTEVYLCMELMDMSLSNFYQLIHKKLKIKFPEEVVGYVVVKVVDALNFCKSKGIMHRDIKPSNILVSYR